MFQLFEMNTRDGARTLAVSIWCPVEISVCLETMQPGVIKAITIKFDIHWDALSGQ
ncbi:hypothetical protein HanRHA438_Chr06g0287021 [Helianthus annuus]|uniref:Uncharacterized protein n=1 Tax=Helianthus annuus TaxID=4232 RepID=A0A9K3IW85_HELAN|nr:hypothetical protein HanXRQr2_Chr06g0277811 [Helianthus annuus]KAJ0561873.1 hypothetical protein HanHA300_Chr06g0227951 [Helianthus annuus]KAJ0568682.1 hypothetical protein HanIR_Chr06g0298931 [Helianthus annuus]KAJ0574938.1 hypothetical protein HanHA89_Chr06g0243901 [Helianthus annuus]KAJ0739269.1 hypothetical protein HanLR1_Chr06g0227961 [Helianthus annuus]